MKTRIQEDFITACSKQDISGWAKERKFNLSVLKELKIGLCTVEAMGELNKKYGIPELKEAGFLNVKDRWKYINRIIIPYSDDYFAARSQDRTAKKWRNLFPKGLKKRAFVIQGTDNQLFVTEGETDAIRLKQEFPESSMFSLGGCRAAKTILDNLLKQFHNYKIILALDKDSEGQKAQEEIVYYFKKKQVSNDLRICHWDNQYKDIDDYFIFGGRKEEIKYEAVTIKPEENDYGIYKKGLNLFMPNKEDIAEQFYKIQPYFYDEIGLFWFFDQSAKCYVMKNEFQVMAAIKQTANEKMFQVTQNHFWTECLRSLKLIGTIHKPEPFKKTWIQFGDKIYDYITQESFEATPDYFNANPIPYKVGNSKETKEIDKLFEQWAGTENVRTLKECIGLSVLQDYPLHRLIILFGRGLNGKGVFQSLLRKFLGDRNICSSTLNKLIKSNFEAAKLYKKLCCIMGETDFNTLSDTSILKQLTGQDLISAEFKGKNAFDFVNFATIFIASNSLPITLDKTQGFYRRPLIIDFPNTFEEGFDPLSKIPEYEYENLSAQLLELIPELISRGRFYNDGNVEERRLKYEEKSNPLTQFIAENYKKDINEYVIFFEFFERFTLYCKDRGFRELNKKNVSQLLADMGFETQRKDIKRNNEWKQWYVIFGLSYHSDSSDSTLTPNTYKEIELTPRQNGQNDTKILPFDQKCIVWQQCIYPIQNDKSCAETPCNLYEDGLPYCKEHFAKIQEEQIE